MSSPRTWLVRLLWFLIILTLILAFATGGGVVWLHRAMRAQLPQVDGDHHTRAVLAPVTVQRDARGVPHLDAQSIDDLIAAQGYVTAQDRLWQMDMIRRMAAGEAAEVLGSQFVEHDRMQRVLAFRPTAERLAASLPPRDRAYFDAYARGVNAYIEDSREHLPAEFRLLGYAPRPWHTADSMLAVLTMVELLDTQWPTKLTRERIEARLGPVLAADLYPTGSWRDHPPLPPAQSLPHTVPASSPAAADTQPGPQSTLEDILRLQALLGRSPLRAASNEWAVSGAHTASGLPLLSNDMHLPLQVPGIWYQTDLHAGAFHVAGVSIPGVPFVVAGHNAQIAWGLTAMGGDIEDVVIEKVNARGEYWANGSWHEMERDRQTVRVRWGRDQSFDVFRTDDGPVITPLLPQERRTLCLRSTIYNPAIATGAPLFDLNAATDWGSFEQAIRAWWAPTLNIVYADRAGHIGYQAAARIPLRPFGLSGIPVAAGAGWSGVVPFAAMPSVLDPPNGILATANARITPDGYPYPLTLAWASPYRNERIWKWLAGKDKLTRSDMLTLQTDVYSELDQELAQRMAHAIDQAPAAGPRLRTAADLLRSWNGVLAVDSPAAAIVTAARRAFWPVVLEPKLGADWNAYEWPESDFAQEELIAHRPAAWLPASYANWDVLLAAAVQQGLAEAHAPDDLRSWRYGSLQTVDLAHPLFGRLPFFAWTGTGRLPQSGDGTTVKQVAHNFGPSQRFTMDWADVDSSTENIVLGESGDPVSPHYRDQWDAWYNGRTFPMPFSSTAVAAAARHTLTLLP